MKISEIILVFLIAFLPLQLMAGNSIVIDHGNWNPNSWTISELNNVRNQKIMFGHKSVGTNIVEGLTSLSDNQANRYGLSIILKPYKLDQPAFGHWKNGDNQDPSGKISAFNTQMRSLDANNHTWASTLNIALFKFCYIDFNTESVNVNDLFNQYISTMNGLKTDFPNCQFVYVTAPLSALIYSDDKDRNVRRNSYNELLRTYVNDHDEILFDIADLEAHNENGDYVSFEYNGSHYPMMWYDESNPENNGWSNDGGHLNNKGKEHIALAMWSLLCEIANQSQSDVEMLNNNTITENYHLSQNFPNPFNPMTTIPYRIEDETPVKISVHNINGQHITTLIEKHHTAGEYHVRFDARSLPAGIYIYSIESTYGKSIKKMILLP